jgi:hypothetical protein
MYSSSAPPIKSFQILLLEGLCSAAKLKRSDTFEEKTIDRGNLDKGELLSVLAFVFSEQRRILENALELAEEGNIFEYETMHSSRFCWSVPSSRGKPYLCYREFCPCRSFQDLSRQTLDRVMVSRGYSVSIDRLLYSLMSCIF